ncbi:molybdopterin-binding protein [Histidinibacterium aquaticum]|uniref:Molybdopterin-binding protein n=1 Tax=Histidinibacterium aquaticum TaxID=2613962 RepID=A0A5J5GLI8_9RHOB|nr:molybdopterin-binding protein [Histidinibacterium aquaticum]KAA9009105.1 molybdopterin-binding protein [Histidinibacterium aquaticum]
MRFGAVPLAEAEGAVLAHSLRAGELRIGKGTRLGPADIAALRGAGVGEVTVARLELDDVDENSAAARLARALVGEGQGLKLTEAATGRVNVHASGPGLARIDAGRIAAVNAVDPMVTVATVPEWQRCTEGTMIATIKIISYAVPEEALGKACRAGQGAIGHVSPRLSTAALIETETGRPASDKGARATQERLSRLGVAMSEPLRVPHEVAPLADALKDCSEDLLLILTGSATSDSHDTAPEALRRAGGEVIRFGMPVDPGNLLFLGRLGARPVIGLPGCARSPALNGADWVLERVICGLPVGAEDIAAMGVGGLLKEIPSRPRPRDHRKG